jgi:hypothetical protein
MCDQSFCWVTFWINEVLEVASIGENLPYGNRATGISDRLYDGVPYASDEHYRSDEFLHTPQQMSRPDELEGRPFSGKALFGFIQDFIPLNSSYLGPSRRTQQSKKHDHKPSMHYLFFYS